MPTVSTSDVAILGLGVILAGTYLFRDQIFASKQKLVPVAPAKTSNGHGNPRDFIAKMKEGVWSFDFFCLSQSTYSHLEKASSYLLWLANWDR